MEEDLFDISVGTLGRALGQSIHNRDWLQSWHREVQELQQAKHDYQRRLQTLVDETKPEHLGRRKSALQAEFAKVLASHKAQHVDGLEKHIMQLQRSVKPKEPPNDLGAMMKYLQLQEIRQSIKDKDPVWLRGEYESRSQDTSGQHDLWLEAVESAPIPLLPGEVLDTGRQSRNWRAMDPKHREQLSDLQALKDGSDYLLTLAGREIPPVDEIARMAAGEPPEPEAA